jgi:hypothetical protein
MKWIALTALILVAAPVGADPSPVIRQLMNEPVSMLDWGLLRLETYLQDYVRAARQIGPIAGSRPVALVQTSYDFDKNEIHIEFAFDSSDVYATSTQDACKQALTAIRHTLVMKRDDGTYLAYFYHFFLHNGFTTSEVSTKVVPIAELLKLVRIDVSLFGRPPKDAHRQFECTGSLLGTSVQYQEDEQ